MRNYEFSVNESLNDYLTKEINIDEYSIDHPRYMADNLVNELIYNAEEIQLE